MGVEARLQIRNFFRFHPGVPGGRLVKFFVVDTHWEGVDLDHPLFQVHLVEGHFKAQQPAYGTQKVPFIIVGVEADQVGTQQAAQYLVPPGQGTEYFIGREGDMKEKPD